MSVDIRIFFYSESTRRSVCRLPRVRERCTVESLNSTTSVFLVASSCHPREDVRNKLDVSARMSRGCYEENCFVEFKLNLELNHARASRKKNFRTTITFILRSLKGRCYGNQLISGLFANDEYDRLQSLHWRFETECSIAIMHKDINTGDDAATSCKIW